MEYPHTAATSGAWFSQVPAQLWGSTFTRFSASPFQVYGVSAWQGVSTVYRGPLRRAQSQMGPILQHEKVKSNTERVFEVRSGAVSPASKTPQQKWSYIITAALLKTSPTSGLCLDLQLDPFVWQRRQSKTGEAKNTRTHIHTQACLYILHATCNMSYSVRKYTQFLEYSGKQMWLHKKTLTALVLVTSWSEM